MERAPDPRRLRTELPRDLDAVVVGAGVIGLTAALALQATGRRVAVITREPVDQTTSNVAAAVWFPVEVEPRDRVLAWGVETLRVLSAMTDADPAAAVTQRDTVMLYREPPGRPWWTQAVPGVREARHDELPAGYAHGLAFTVPFADMPVHLRWLAERLVAGGGSLHLGHVTALDELSGVAPVVVNAAGLGARELAHDPTVVPVRGQVVRTTNPGLRVSLRDQHHPEGYTYVHPRTDDVVLGGSFERGRHERTPDADLTAAIVARCTALAPALAEAEVIGPVVGLRPGRPTVRLERDDSVVPGTTVVHDYGHGGAGVTLAWGCAAEVVRLVDGAAT